jgi:hypothetical protein
MYETHPNHSLLTFVVEFRPVIDYPVRVGAAAAEIATEFDSKAWWWPTVNSVAFRDTTRGLLVVSSFNLFAIQALGVNAWTEKLEALLSITPRVLTALSIKEIAQVSLRSKGFFNVGMSHSELVEATFGSYLLPQPDLADVSPSFDDVLLKLYGKDGQSKFELSIAPQTAEQAKGDFYAWHNIDVFNDPRSRNNAPAEFWSKIDRDCLNIECHLSRKDVGPESVIPFMRSSLGQAGRIATRAVNRLLTLPTGI